MGDVTLPAIIREGFSISFEQRDQPCLKLTGNADMEMLPVLGPLLSQFHAQVLQQGSEAVIVDMRELYFMNSSCFKSMLTWISDISKLGSIGYYRVRFLTNRKLHWQKRNLESMQAFAPGLVEIVAS